MHGFDRVLHLAETARLATDQERRVPPAEATALVIGEFRVVDSGAADQPFGEARLPQEKRSDFAQ